MSYLTRAVLLCWAATLALGHAADPADRQGARVRSFEFALIGDMPYNEFDATNSFPHLIAELNAARLAFVVHDGDFKAAATPCTRELFERCHRQLQTIRHPLIYVFGDNEWTDCGRKNAGPLDTAAALDLLRDLFCSGNESLGKRRLKLARQSEAPGEFTAFRENVRWAYGNVAFVTLNVPGDANNFGAPEAAVRNRANLAWLQDAFARATADNRRALMIVMQANPHFELAATNRLRAGFNELLGVLERETIAFARPVVLVHGDSHYFRIDKPLVSSRRQRRIENFTRVETFGNPDVHWLRARVDAGDPEVFSFRQEIVAKNRIDHRARTP